MGRVRVTAGIRRVRVGGHYAFVRPSTAWALPFATGVFPRAPSASPAVFGVWPPERGATMCPLRAIALRRCGSPISGSACPVDARLYTRDAGACTGAARWFPERDREWPARPRASVRTGGEWPLHLGACKPTGTASPRVASAVPIRSGECPQRGGAFPIRWIAGW